MKGPEVFHGKVIHSMDYAAMDYESAANFVKGKQVTVVGFQKSALDIAMECSVAHGLRNPCTVLYRTEQWNVPANLPRGLPLTCLCLNRFSELLVHKPGEGFFPSLLATMLSPLDSEVIKSSETFLRLKFSKTTNKAPLMKHFLSIEMKCQWLAELLDDTFKLHSIKEMENDMVEWDEYLKRSSGEHYRRSCIALPIWYNDQLCKDMGWNPKRKKGFFAELFESYGPLDYVSPSRSN
ncbi:hypothetical protein EZV62_012016 [Acer yangbiense]|uniref:Flavin-containing monooxygenase n=1 Tax=Acer yangbiense TaxID=1000413 RepID=A0A5C7I8S7_9ROSI|nr:hypothetical protein EZV62_012016 [Acer yangbiense]